MRGRPAATVLASAVALSLAAVSGVLAGGEAREARAGAKAAKGRPNVVVITTDDQWLESMRVMRNVRRRIARRGVSFARSFVNFPLCCPSRATFLTGQYAHNHRVRGNNFPAGGFFKLNSHRTLAVWMRDAGYHTGHVGRYLNGYGDANPEFIPDGWREWYTAVRGERGGPQRVYDYDLNENGAIVHYGTDPADFKQDVFTRKARDFIERRAPRRRPFFLALEYTAPHGAGPDPAPNPPHDCRRGAAKPAPRHAHAFDSEPLPRGPSFNEADVSDKPSEIRSQPRLRRAEIELIQGRYRCRLESLLSVDEGVRRILKALRRADELRRTLVIFTSDNGFFHGQHRIRQGKLRHYDAASRVPLAMRGPGVPRGLRVRRELAINADLAPTILDAANADAGLRIDGRSLLPILADPSRERGRELLIETRGYAAVRTRGYVYVEYSNGERELYDLGRDAEMLHSRHLDPDYAEVRRALARRLARLRDCAGKECRRSPRLRLKLRFRKGRTHGKRGKRCARPPVKVRLRGGERRGVERADFLVDGRRVAIDRNAPFKRKLGGRRFRRRGRTEVRVRATLVDGRRATRDRKLRACR